MLISMPHGTSMIFGAFQAIFGAPCKTGRNSALSIKVTSREKFASEILSPKPQAVPVAARRCGAIPANVHMANCQRIKGFDGSHYRRYARWR
jgi:uncharacterized protein YcsI (UPF0317 family)